MSDEEPPQLERLYESLLRLAGVVDVSSTIETVDGLDTELLRSIDFAHVPHGAYRRTRGGLKGEALIQITFGLTPDDAGWNALEFLAWWVRDLARSGEMIQLSPFALPPVAGPTIQLGETLHFQIDLFRIEASSDVNVHFAKVAGLAEGFTFALNFYDRQIQDLGGDSIIQEPA